MEIQNLRNQYKQKIQKNKENLFNKLRFLAKIDQQLIQTGGRSPLLLENGEKYHFTLTVFDDLTIDPTNNAIIRVDTNQPIRHQQHRVIEQNKQLYLENDLTKPLERLEDGEVITQDGFKLTIDGTDKVLKISTGASDNCLEGFNGILSKLAANDTLITRIEEGINQKMKDKNDKITLLEKELAECRNKKPDKCESLEAEIEKLKNELDKLKKCNEEKKRAMDDLQKRVETQNTNLAKIVEELDQQ
jgi:hypothetical protein